MKWALYVLLYLLLLCGCVAAPSDTQPSFSFNTIETTEATSIPTTTATEATVPKTQSVLAGSEQAGTVFDPMSIVSSMTLEEKVGQLFLAACPDTNALKDLQTYHLGGYLLFGGHFDGETPDPISQAIASWQAASQIPMLIAVDEEGGTVCRVSSHSAFRNKRFSSPRTLYNKGGLELVISTEEEKCQLLRSLGINVNMAPVCDVTTDPNAFMYKRSLGESPETTGVFATAMVKVMNTYQIGSVLKHFPGYGNNTDTHTGIAVDNRDLQSLLENDLIPFAAGIGANCGAILVSHTVVECMDGEYPASLSPAVHKFLREEMDFTGVIVTDDLTMEAITDLYGSGEAAVLAVLAGNDLLCTFEYPVQYQAVLEAVQDGRIPQELIDRAVCRILQWKYDLGSLDDLTNYT